MTSCFQRDSAKDQVVVLVFIAATVGLLGWAGLRPWVEGWKEVCILGWQWGIMRWTLTIYRKYKSDEIIFQFLRREIDESIENTKARVEQLNNLDMHL